MMSAAMRGLRAEANMGVMMARKVAGSLFVGVMVCGLLQVGTFAAAQTAAAPAAPSSG